MAEKAARYVIIGNGIAGTVAAERLRAYDRSCHVTLLTNEPYALYNRVKLPYYVKGIIAEQEVFMRSAGDAGAHGIELLPETTVRAVDTAEKCVQTEDGRRLPYDRLLIATGGRPKRLDAPGADAPAVFSYQYLDDAKAMRALLPQARSAVVVGGSLIGYEFVAACREWNLETTWMIRGPYFMHRQIDAQAGAVVDAIARRHGVNIVYGDEVADIQRSNGDLTGVRTTSGASFPCQMLGCALGLKKNIEFLDGSAVEVNEGVLTDACLATSDPNVFAAGDVAEFEDLVIGRRSLLGTWHNASQQGDLVAKNMLGARTPFKAVPIYSNPLFDSRFKVIGITSNTDPTLESLVRNEPELESYLRLFFRDDQLVGATIIGKVDYHLRVSLLEHMLSGERVRDKQALIETRSHNV